MLATNAELEIGFTSVPRSAATAMVADAFDIEADERIAGEDALLDISGEETAGIVAADAERGLGEVERS